MRIVERIFALCLLGLVAWIGYGSVRAWLFEWDEDVFAFERYIHGSVDERRVNTDAALQRFTPIGTPLSQARAILEQAGASCRIDDSEIPPLLICFYRSGQNRKSAMYYMLGGSFSFDTWVVRMNFDPETGRTESLNVSTNTY